MPPRAEGIDIVVISHLLAPDDSPPSALWLYWGLEQLPPELGVLGAQLGENRIDTLMHHTSGIQLAGGGSTSPYRTFAAASCAGDFEIEPAQV